MKEYTKYQAKALKQKLEFMEQDESVSKQDLIEILYMSIEEGISTEEAIEGCVIPAFEAYDESQFDESRDWEEYCEDSYEQHKNDE